MGILTPAQVFRKFVTDGASESGAHEPVKSEIVQLLERIEQSSSAGIVVRQTKAALDAVTPDDENAGGWVLNDSTASNNGYYYRSGGAWVKGRGFPDSVAVLTGIGGTANAITASTEAGVNPADVQMIILPDPPGTNTSQTVTIALNGGATEDIKAASGASVAIGDIIEGVGTLFFRFGTEWRQIFSSATGATFDHQGTWAAPTTYTEGQVVTGSNGNWYQLKAASSTGDDPVGSVTGDWLQILAAAAIPDGSLVEAKYATGSVSTRALADEAATLVKIGDDAKSDFRLVDPNGPRDLLVWASAQTVNVYGTSWAMGGFRRFGRYSVDRAPVFPASTFRNTLAMSTHLSHGMTSPTFENWYAAFAVANDGDANASFEISPFLYVKSVDAGTGVVTLGKCGEVDDVNVIDDATYAWADNALVGTEVLVITEMFSALAWTMRETTVTANTAGTITLADIGTVDVGSMLLLAPSGWDRYRYCAPFYYDTAEVRNMFDGGGGPVRCRMGGVNIVKAHGNDGTNSTYLDGPVAQGAKKLTLTRFIPPLATGVFLESKFLIASSTTGLRAQIYFDMDGGGHIPVQHDFVKDGADQNSPVQDVFLTFKGNQFLFPFTDGASESLIARVSMSCAGWFEP